MPIMPDQYAVFGNPISHSLSPDIHSDFANQTQQNIEYAALLSPVDSFANSVLNFVEQGGKGFNVTVPFKEQAWELCTTLSERAKLAGAVNTVSINIDGSLLGDNTDGSGLVTDIISRHQQSLQNKRILILGAGGAVRGIIEPLLQENPSDITVANRTVAKAETLADIFSSLGSIKALSITDLETNSLPFDIVINGTSSSLHGEMLTLSPSIISDQSFCYDMMYSKQATPFNKWASAQGAVTADGLGMLVEQAAEAFFIWRGVRANTDNIFNKLR